MYSELSHTLQSLSERIGAVTDLAEAEAIQIEIDQTWVQNEDDNRITSILDDMTMRLAEQVRRKGEMLAMMLQIGGVL